MKKGKPAYCTQNNGDCRTCSLVNYGYDCRNVKIKIDEQDFYMVPETGAVFSEKELTDLELKGGNVDREKMVPVQKTKAGDWQEWTA